MRGQTLQASAFCEDWQIFRAAPVGSDRFVGFQHGRFLTGAALTEDVLALDPRTCWGEWAARDGLCSTVCDSTQPYGEKRKTLVNSKIGLKGALFSKSATQNATTLPVHFF
jgi:hypothetical protein